MITHTCIQYINKHWFLLDYPFIFILYLFIFWFIYNQSKNHIFVHNNSTNTPMQYGTYCQNVYNYIYLFIPIHIHMYIPYLVINLYPSIYTCIYPTWLLIYIQFTETNISSAKYKWSNNWSKWEITIFLNSWHCRVSSIFLYIQSHP